MVKSLSNRGLLVLALLALGCSDAGSPSDAARLRFVALSGGSAHSCGRTDQGATYCWGSNFTGQLGARTDDEANPIPLQIVVRPLALTQISSGATFSCGLLNTGAPICWGNKESSPRLLRGAGIFSGISAGLSICGVRDDARVICWDNPDAEPYSIEGPAFTQVSVGGMGCALAGDGSAWCWQAGSRVAQPVAGNLTFMMITTGSGHACGIAPDQQAYCWGLNSHGQLGNNSRISSELPDTVSSLYPWTNISAGGFHTCGVTTTGGAYCWGAASSGQLGYDAPSPVQYLSAPTRVRGGDLPAGAVVWNTVAAGGNHSCGATVEGLTFCWGENGNGQLGNGDTEDSVGPVAIGPSE
jgi:alpha-tubulin suppressor-like RCC1 family protein